MELPTQQTIITLDNKGVSEPYNETKNHYHQSLFDYMLAHKRPTLPITYKLLRSKKSGQDREFEFMAKRYGLTGK